MARSFGKISIWTGFATRTAFVKRNSFTWNSGRSFCNSISHNNETQPSKDPLVQSNEPASVTSHEISEPQSKEPISNPSSFRSAFEKFTSDDILNPKTPSKPEESFATLFRNSKFVHLGDPKGKIVIGNIYHVVGDDLYVDFGWKFPCVVRRPTTNPGLFVRNAKVRLRINDLELSTRFLGGSNEMSLNEADCTLVGLVSSPLGRNRQTSV